MESSSKGGEWLISVGKWGWQGVRKVVETAGRVGKY